MLLRKLQNEVAEWAKENFGKDRPAYRRLLGVIEEVGELSHAHLKGEEGIRHTKDEIRLLKKDAIGDIVIFLVDYCIIENFDLENCVSDTWKIVQKRN